MALVPSDSKWRIIVTVLAAVGAPVTFGVAFPQVIARWPISAIVGVILYEALLLTIGFFSSVWKHLEQRWAKELATLLADAIESAFLRYKMEYLRQVVFWHRVLDVKGLSTQGIYTLQIEQVFVDLSVVPQPAHRIPSNLLGEHAELVPGKRYSIQDFLIGEKLPYRSIAVIGPPGSGKTTLLKHVALSMAQRKVSRRFRRIPILIILREHADSIAKNRSCDLVSIVVASASKMPLAIPQRWFEKQLKKNRCLIMLDGLDEIADPKKRKIVAAWADDQIAKYGLSRFIITSRPFGYNSNPLKEVTIFEVRPFSLMQIRKFVHNWYLANEIMAAGNKDDEGVRLKASSDAQDLLGRLQKTPDLVELAVNPLLLTMIATVHRFRSSLPGRRVELYSEICDVFLGNRQRAKGIDVGDIELTPAQKRRVLEPLAHRMMCDKRREIGRSDALKIIESTVKLVSRKATPKQFLKDIEDLSGILLERENAVYSFAHLTFQEYLCAAHIRSHNLQAEILEHVDDGWWHEVLRLYSAQADASPIITACLASEHPSIEAMTLATQCIEEAFEVRPEVHERLEAILAKATAEEERRLLAQQRLKLRLRKLTRSPERWLLDDSLITSAEYQTFLDDVRATGKNYSPDHWPLTGYNSENAARPVDGVRAADASAFCQWLTEREGNGYRYRLPTPEEAQASPLQLVSVKTPLYYWVAAQPRPMLASASEAPRERPTDFIHAVAADLTLLLHDDLGLAGATELAHENWNLKRFRGIATDQFVESVDITTSMDFDQTVLRCTAAAISYHPGDAVIKSALWAVVWELSRERTAVVGQEYYDSVFASLESTPPTKEHEFAVELIWRLEQISPEKSSMYLSEELRERFAFIRQQLVMRNRNRLESGSGMQSPYRRNSVARGLSSLVLQPAHDTEHIAEILQWQHAGDTSLRRRALLRLLSLACAWIAAARYHPDHGLSPLEIPRTLLQAFIDLTIMEERIGGLNPATESIRVVREMITDDLESTFAAQEQLQSDLVN